MSFLFCSELLHRLFVVKYILFCQICNFFCRVCSMKVMSQNYLFDNAPLLYIAKNDLSDRDIILLSNAFLTSGFHNIQVLSFQGGRDLLWKFLEYLKYSNVACLSVNYRKNYKNEFVINLYDKFSQEYNEQAINDFLLNEFCFDFLWIECSKELVKESWFLFFKNKLIEYEIANDLPIIAFCT